LKGKQVTVTAYAGYRGEEQPRSFILAHDRIDVIEVVSQWREKVLGDRSGKRCFRVKGSDGYVHVLSCHEETHQWYLE